MLNVKVIPRYRSPAGFRQRMRTGRRAVDGYDVSRRARNRKRGNGRRGPCRKQKRVRYGAVVLEIRKRVRPRYRNTPRTRAARKIDIAVRFAAAAEGLGVIARIRKLYRSGRCRKRKARGRRSVEERARRGVAQGHRRAPQSKGTRTRSAR